MRLKRQILLTLALSMPAAPVLALCDTYWLRLAGKDEQGHLQVEGGWGLDHFNDWEPRAHHRARNASSLEPELQWRRVTEPPHIAPVGFIAGGDVSEIVYSPFYRVLLWDQGDDYFCPILLLQTDDRIVGGLGQWAVFLWEKQEILSVRIYYRGMGALQSSLFFSAVDGRLKHLRQQPMVPALKAKGIQLHHRGGGFCKHSLVWEKQAWREADDEQHGVARVVYSVRKMDLLIESVELLTDFPSDECDPYYESKANR